MQNPNHPYHCDCTLCELWLTRHEREAEAQRINYDYQYSNANNIWNKNAKIDFRRNVKSWYQINRKNGMNRRAALDNAYLCAID